jgi:putative membrane protein
MLGWQRCSAGNDVRLAMVFGWLGLAAVVGVQISYPLVSGDARAKLVVVTVLLGWLLSVGHALGTRGWRVASALVAITTGGGLLVEAMGAGTGFPFGGYTYGDALGPKLLGVPLIIPLAWTWMAWPAWLAAGRLTRHAMIRVGLAGLGLAAWDLFLDPQMVRERYWRWSYPSPTLPGVHDVPVGNHLGWLAVALAMMALLAATPAGTDRGRDAPMLALYLWTYYSSILAHAVFLQLPASALWGGLGMGLVAVPLTVRLIRR